MKQKMKKKHSQYILPRLVDHFDFLKSEEQGINSHLVPGYVALSKMGSRVQGTTLGRMLTDGCYSHVKLKEYA
jgi:hypothetical protein